MTELAIDPAPDGDPTLLCRLTPSGRIDLYWDARGGDASSPSAAQQRIFKAFQRGRGHGVLHLGIGELDTNLHPSLSYWRDFGKTFTTAVCGALDPTEPELPVIHDPTTRELSDFVEAAPPMPGAELITHALLEELWADLGDALIEQAARRKTGVQGYLKSQDPIWHVVGRVCLHLAENKGNPSAPFAFMATYVHKVSKQARP